MQILFGVLLLLAAGQSINFFSLKQDIEIGNESAKEAELSLALVSTGNFAHRHINAIGARITRSRSLPPIKYQIRIVNSKDINSVGFPGGAIYVNRGLLEVASNDDEIAAIVAHEVSHIASRHGTAQLSRQLLVQAPTAIAAGIPPSQVWRDEIAKLGIALGTDAPFLRYTRDQEIEATVMTVRLVAEARYDPNAVHTLAEKIAEAQTSEAPRSVGFSFNHPQAQTVAPEVLEVIDQAGPPPRTATAGVDFRAFHSALLKLPAPAAKATSSDADELSTALPNVFTHTMDYYRLGFPTGWIVNRTGPNGAMIAPADGVQSSRNGDDLHYGAMFDLFDIAVPDKSLTLEQATNRLIVFLRQRNQSLRVVPGAQTQMLVSDEPALRTVLIEKPATTGQPEVAWVVTRLYYQSLFYMVLVAPEDEFPTYQPIFEQMIRSVRFR